MIDNFDQISKLLTWNSEDEFYFVQILQRKKDNPGNVHGSNNSSRLIKAYYIDSLEKFNKQKDEMIQLANLFNARVGINLNKRSFYKTAFNTLQTMANQMHNKEFKYLYRSWNTACGIHNGIDDKIWLLDIDNKDKEYSKKVKIFVNELCNPKYVNKIIDDIPSKSGHHIITRGFDTRLFRETFPEIEIHKNNPVNLWIP